MKKFIFTSLLCFLLSLPALGFGQLNIAPVNGGQGGGGITFSGANSISQSMLNQILTIAAPQFGMIPADFVTLYQTCGCVTVEQIGPNTYFVSYGGLGIQIIIDGSRFSRPMPTYTPIPGPKR